MSIVRFDIELEGKQKWKKKQIQSWLFINVNLCWSDISHRKSWKQCHCQCYWLSGKSDTDISECAYLFYLFPLMIDDRLPFERALFSSNFTPCASFVELITFFRRVHCLIAFISGQGKPFRLMCIKCEANKLNWMETIAKDATNDLNSVSTFVIII